MERDKLVPKKSKHISIYNFSENEFLIHQEKLNHRIKVSRETLSLINRVDGSKTLKEIEEEINNVINVNTIYYVLFEKLGKYGIIDSDIVKPIILKKPNYLKLSFIVISPNLISKITPYLKFLFDPKIMKATIVSCLLIIGIILFKNNNLIFNIEKTGTNWFLLFFLSFISVTFHEFGHVTATEYFGAKQNGIGGGFYVFSPVYFADVTDIWKLKTNQRIIVNIAGVYFELIMCAIFSLFGIMLDFNILITLSGIILIKTLFNLNPFMRSDGYWIVTDYFAISNLYMVSNNNLLSLFKSIFNISKFEFNKKSILLSLYALTNYGIILIFLVYTIYYNSESILYFPINIYYFIMDIKTGNPFNVIEMSSFMIPFLFYYLLINYLLNLKFTRIYST